ncbi:MAG: ABC transporter ATP-binding protein [Leptospirales bacterium]
MKVLEADSLSKIFMEGRERVVAMQEISLSLEQNEIVTLEGPSGSGKTTLLSVVGCLLSPTSGSLTIEGRRVDPDNALEMAFLRRETLGFVFQQYNLFPALSVLDNVLYSLQVRGKTDPDYAREARTLLEEVGLGHRLSFLPEHLSGGEKQRVAIARALSGRSRIILADEPTANLDSRVGLEILEIFRRLAKEENRTLLIVTHDPLVRKMSDRVIRMRDGMLLGDS